MATETITGASRLNGLKQAAIFVKPPHEIITGASSLNGLTQAGHFVNPPQGTRAGGDDPLIPVTSFAITPANGDVNVAGKYLRGAAKYLYVGVGGTIVAQMVNDVAPVTYVGVPTGALLPGAWILVKKTGTTATNLVVQG